MICVELFGDFRIYSSDDTCTNGITFPAKSGCVLAYILLNRERYIMKEELMDIFWSNSSSSNPVSAFKSLIFRIRSELTRHFGASDYITEQNGAYRWNEDIPVEIDAERFSEKISRIKEEALSNAEKIALFESVIRMYKGDFLSNAHNYYWADLTGGYYRSLNTKVIIQLIYLYRKEQQYAKLELLCVDSLKANFIDEEIYYYLILSRIFLYKQKEAKETYNRALVVLREELGIEHSERLESLKTRIFTLKNPEPKNIEAVNNEIEEQEMQGAFICNYSVFMEICRLEYRKMIREAFDGETSIVSRHILLMTVSEKAAEPETGVKVDEEIMKKFEKLIRNNIRVGDVICRCSENQYVFLLLGCTIQDCIKISNRINNQIRRMKIDAQCDLQYQQLTAGNMMQRDSINR